MSELAEAEQKAFPAFLEAWEVYRDEHLLIVNKPAGLLCHPGADPRRPDLVALIRARYASEVPEIVLQHRLDRETSGLVVLTVSAQARVCVYRQVEAREMKRFYLAWVAGAFPQRCRCERPLVERKGRVRTGDGGQAACTQLERVRTDGGFSLVEARPQTGRKHQIRVHLASMGHPIVGDVLYGGKRAQRLMLHATRLELLHPDGSELRLEAAPGPEFTARGPSRAG